MMATKQRQRRRRPNAKPVVTIGVIPKELWIIKPVLGALAIVLLINVLFVATLETLSLTIITEDLPSNEHGIGVGMPVHNIMSKSSTGISTSTSTSTVKMPRRTPRSPNQPLAFRFNRQQAEAVLAKYGASRLRERVLIAAYLEPPLTDIVPGTINQGDPTNATDVGAPPRFIEPLPTRVHRPSDLKKVIYPKFQTCHDLPSKLPVDRGLILDDHGNVVVWNTPTKPDPSYDDSPHCPVDGDPHLPWIHDIVPTHDRIRFVAQNKRRCNTGNPQFAKTIQQLSPQVSLFQPISIKKISQQQAKHLAPELYQGDSSTTATEEVRYRLADHHEADYQQTRFRCLFTATNLTSGHPQVIGETLSVYPFNYEYVIWRRSIPTMLNPRGTDKANIYTATLLFDCPIPLNLQPLVASGNSILSDGTPTLHIDLIPIRTSPRYGIDQVHFTEAMAGPKDTWHEGTSNRTLWRDPRAPLRGFNVAKQWGSRHVLPLAAASGRWTNLPICQPVSVRTNTVLEDDDEAVEAAEAAETKEATPVFNTAKPYNLVACVWASASYATRGTNVTPTTSSLDRINEWLEFALLVGFDHVYVYDNSAANHATLNLQPVTDQFDNNDVTRIQWDHAVCNNNQPNGINPGERSSQYAAENSCRVRFGPLTEWMASFDLDEYLIPMGSYTSLQEVTRDAADKGHSILGFRSTRTKLRLDASQPVQSNGDNDARMKNASVPFLEAYNCDTQPSPKPVTSDRARKEIYRPDYVLYHFVHYSLVTKTVASFYADSNKDDWERADEELKYPDHPTNETFEAVMVHAKSGNEMRQNNWRRQCQLRKRYKSCVIGLPWPRGRNWTEQDGEAMTSSHFLYNCHENTKVADYWVPKLKKAMKDRASNR